MEDINDLNPYLPLETVVRGSILVTTQKATDISMMKGFGTVPVESFGRDMQQLFYSDICKLSPQTRKRKR